MPLTITRTTNLPRNSCDELMTVEHCSHNHNHQYFTHVTSYWFSLLVSYHPFIHYRFSKNNHARKQSSKDSGAIRLRRHCGNIGKYCYPSDGSGEGTCVCDDGVVKSSHCFIVLLSKILDIMCADMLLSFVFPKQHICI